MSASLRLRLVSTHCAWGAGAAHLEFLMAMEAEHCHRAKCDEEFETLNYRIRSTPKTEWRVVVTGNSPACNTDMRCACATRLRRAHIRRPAEQRRDESQPGRTMLSRAASSQASIRTAPADFALDAPHLASAPRREDSGSVMLTPLRSRPRTGGAYAGLAGGSQLLTT